MYPPLEVSAGQEWYYVSQLDIYSQTYPDQMYTPLEASAGQEWYCQVNLSFSQM